MARRFPAAQGNFGEKFFSTPFIPKNPRLIKVLVRILGKTEGLAGKRQGSPKTSNRPFAIASLLI
jgi:hypothetical protein